jgi:hypothetical protein
VPRSQSWPDRRTGGLQQQSVPKASASAVAQSMPFAGLDHLARAVSRKRWMVLWTFEAFRHVVSFLPISFSVFDSTPVSPRAVRLHYRPCAGPTSAPSSQSALFGL